MSAVPAERQVKGPAAKGTRLLGWLAVVAVLGLALLWAALDATDCSSWSRIKIVTAKFSDELPYVSWGATLHPAACEPTVRSEDPIFVRSINHRTMQGATQELYETNLGRFWIPAPGSKLLLMLMWELTVQRDYESEGVTVRPGDTVIDCGAHVGTFTRYALARGATTVVAVEPDPLNMACLRENFAQEIAERRVIAVQVGVWDHAETLRLLRRVNSGSSTVVTQEGSTPSEYIALLPLDQLVKQLGLARVDFIKMDIEGAEVKAIDGARETLRHYKPRMALCSYHQVGDERALARMVLAARPDYRIHAKDIETSGGWVRTKVLFFE